MRPLSYSPRPLKSSRREATCGVGSGRGGGRPTPVSSSSTSDEMLCRKFAACQPACVASQCAAGLQQALLRVQARPGNCTQWSVSTSLPTRRAAEFLCIQKLKQAVTSLMFQLLSAEHSHWHTVATDQARHTCSGANALMEPSSVRGPAAPTP